MEKLVKKWEKKTNYSMDYDDFESIHYRDVNNYFHCDPDNTSSGIGYFAKHSLGKNLDNFIVSKACMDFVKDGVSVEKTIYENKKTGCLKRPAVCFDIVKLQFTYLLHISCLLHVMGVKQYT